MVIADKTKLSTTVCTAIFQLGHGVILQIEDTIRTTVRREKSNIVARLLSTPSALRTCGPTQRRVGRHIGETHCRELSAKLMFRNRASLVKTLRTEVRFGMLSPQAAGAGIDYTARFRGRTAIRK